MTHITDSNEVMENRIRDLVSEMDLPDTDRLAEDIILSCAVDVRDFHIPYDRALRTALSRLGETIYFTERRASDG